MEKQRLNMGIRRAETSDLALLVVLENRCFNVDRISRRSFQRFLKGQRCSCWVVECGSVIVAYVLLLFRRGSSLARVYSLAVDETCRGLGLGRTLLERGEQDAIEKGCLFIRLEVSANNSVAQVLYLAAGYKVFDRTEAYYEDGSSALRLEKPIDVKGV